jgi:hypothetical protein
MKTALLCLLCLLIVWNCGSEPQPAPRRNIAAAAGPKTDSSAAPEQGETSFPPPPAPDSRPEEEARAASRPELVEIQEKLFLSQTNDIYINPDEYQNKLIKLEGMWFAVKDENDGSMHYLLIRYGPGCCGYDGVAGFEVMWEGNYPRDNDWVEGIGALEKYGAGEEEYLRLRLSALKVLARRGQETVYR